MKKSLLRSITFLTLVALLSSVPTAHAAVFPDVPDGHMYQTAVEKLVSLGVINGNPDGSFYPDRSVNRAEMLKMLYLATDRTPDPDAAKCFPDVQPGSWYESYVCDAALSNNRFVVGYADGTFRPAETVNRVEALKMIQEVYGFEIPELTEYTRDVVNFADISTSAWYTKYLFNAYDTGLLPIAGQSSSHFYPEAALLRGEAAAMIFNALSAGLRLEREEIEEQLEEEEEEAAAAEEEAGEVFTEQIKDVEFPFEDQGQFDGKKTFSYNFAVVEGGLVLTDVELAPGESGQVRCTLFRMEEDGNTYEYYIGSKWASKCTLLTQLEPGSYQLQLQPTAEDVGFSVSSGKSSEYGDGNDGFSNAITLSSAHYPGSLGVHNYADWYRFSVPVQGEDEEGLEMTVVLETESSLTCLVYPMADVDLYGFAGPQCNMRYAYPGGTYYIGIMRAADPGEHETYTVRLSESKH